MGLYSLALILLLGMCIHQFNAEPHFSPNLVVNGGAENGTEGWTVTTGGLARWNYADWSTDPNPPNGESYYFYGAQAAKSIATQKISIPHFSVSFNVSAYFGGWTGQADTATLNLSFLDSFGGMVGSNFTIGGLTAAERNSLSGFFFRSVSGAVPANARVILITLEFTRLEGTDNDGYIDAMSLITLIQPRDCFGVLDGSALIDACGVCGGNNQSCCLNYLGLENSLWDWLLMRDAIDDVIGKLEDLHFIFNCTSDNIPAPPSLCAPPEAAESFKTTLRALQLGDFIDTNNAWSSRCLANFNQQVKKWTCVLNPAECCASSPL